uniref:NOT2/NOT3/NOT5 C-terminal domain-containing protein n=1 Tax=Strigamia maritima TaxID=126957 RepID=T1JMQ2_STRMM
MAGNSPRYGISPRNFSGELSPGAQKNVGGFLGMAGMAHKLKKGFYTEEEENESPDFYFNQASANETFELNVQYEFVQPAYSKFNCRFGQNPIALSKSDYIGMGSLGLQQPSRSLSGQQINRGFSTASISGHLTPTSTSSPSFSSNIGSGLPSQQSSPNSLLSRGILSQVQVGREMKRPVTGSLGLTGFGLTHNSRSFTTPGLMNSSNDAPPALDLSEFPSLTNRGRQDSGGHSMPSMVGRPAYVGMVKQPVSESTEFQIHSEDFPALPGSQTHETDEDNSTTKLVSQFTGSGTGLDLSKENTRLAAEKNGSQSQKIGIQTCPDGGLSTVTNIPAGMVTDQFGMIGLLTFIRAADTEPALVSLALGSDLTTLGLNLNSPENLYPNFGGPFSEVACRPQDIVLLTDFHVPAEYLTNVAIREKLAPIKLSRYGEDLLFYMFYTNGNDVLQLAVAAELYSRDWRFHKEERVWITKPPGMVALEKNSTYERGTYYFFDAQNWRKVAKEFHLDYDKLEERPHLPQSLYHSIGQPLS